MNETPREDHDSVVKAVCSGEVQAETTVSRPIPEAGCGAKPQGFFTELGAPGTPVRGEKLGGFFTRGDSGLISNSQGASHGGAVDPLAPVRNRGGRPTVLTPELKEKLEMLLAVGMSRRQASAYVGIDHTTVVKAAARDPEFRLSLKIAEEQAMVNPLLTIISESRKNWRAAAWLLKYRGSRPAEPEPVETVQLTEEEYEQQREREHQRQLAEDARKAERDKLNLLAMRDRLSAVSSPPTKDEPTLAAMRASRRK